MSEVMLIVFLMAVGTVGLTGLFGDNIRVLFAGSSSALKGNPNVKNTGAQASKTKWTLRGGSLSAYSANKGGGFNPGGTPDYAQKPAPGGGGGFNPGGTVDNGTSR
jgi:hypothetical protein